MSNPIDWNLLKLCDCDGLWHTASNGKHHRPSVYLDDLVEERVRQARIQEVQYLKDNYRQFAWVPAEVAHMDYSPALAALNDRLDTLRVDLRSKEKQ